jgi:hypothetical protein
MDAVMLFASALPISVSQPKRFLWLGDETDRPVHRELNVGVFTCGSHAVLLSSRSLSPMASAPCLAMSSPSSRQEKIGNVRGWWSDSGRRSAQAGRVDCPLCRATLAGPRSRASKTTPEGTYGSALRPILRPILQGFLRPVAHPA